MELVLDDTEKNIQALEDTRNANLQDFYFKNYKGWEGEYEEIEKEKKREKKRFMMMEYEKTYPQLSSNDLREELNNSGIRFYVKSVPFLNIKNNIIYEWENATKKWYKKHIFSDKPIEI